MFDEWYTDDIIGCLKHIDEYSDAYLRQKLDLLGSYIDKLIFGMNIARIIRDDTIPDKKRNELKNLDAYRYMISKYGDTIDFIDIRCGITEKYNKSGCYMYDIPIEQLTYDEILLLICYPFLQRVGDSFEYEFAQNGSLLMYLLRLKELESKM